MNFLLDDSYTLEEVGKHFEVTRERIRQIEAKTMKKLRHPTRREILETFMPDKKKKKTDFSNEYGSNDE